MQYKKTNSFRFYLTEEECGRDDIEITVEYRADQSDPSRGNCFVDYWLSLRDCGFRSHMAGIWLSVNKENILSKIKLHMLRGIEDHIQLYLQYMDCLEEQMQDCSSEASEENQSI